MTTRARDSIEGTTRIVGILGEPVEHSLSPRMHNAAFEHLGLDYAYVPLRASSRTIGEAVLSIKTLGLAGANVTVPFKEKVIGHLDRLSPVARAVGAVNTIYPDGKWAAGLKGENTDVGGFLKALSSSGFRLLGKRVLLIGAGGAARAVLYALGKGGAREVTIANRTVARAKRLAAELPTGKTKIEICSLDMLKDPELFDGVGLVVNSTSTGLSGQLKGYDPSLSGQNCVHFDLAYGRAPTAFTRRARRKRRSAIDGRLMLLHQGVLAFNIFTGRRAPVDVMARALGLPKRR